MQQSCSASIEVVNDVNYMSVVEAEDDFLRILVVHGVEFLK